jgi:hypothetical protein
MLLSRRGLRSVSHSSSNCPRDVRFTYPPRFRFTCSRRHVWKGATHEEGPR